VCVYAHTHTAHGVLDVSPGVETRHLEGPENPDELNFGKFVFLYVYKLHMLQMCIRVCVQSRHVYICAVRWDEIWTSENTDTSNLISIRAKRASSKATRLFLIKSWQDVRCGIFSGVPTCQKL